MFTGIVAHCGEVIAVEQKIDSLRLQIKTQFSDLQVGESIAVDGVCLTVVDPKAGVFSCDVSSETIAMTVIAHYRVGHLVNVERAMLASDRFGGHYVTGHVERVAMVADKQMQGDYVAITFAGLIPQDMRYLVHKGSVCINGVSLTINKVMQNSFEVMLVPHTLERTNLHLLDIASQVNIEFDWMVKVIIHRLETEKLVSEV